MKAWSTLASLVGAALLAAAGLAMLLEPEALWLPAANAGLGVVLIAGSAILDPELFRRYGRWLNAFWGGILVLAILGMVNFLADRYPHRLDLTEGGLHSLAPLTVETLEALEKDVEALAFMEGGENEELRGLLEQYAVHGGGRFEFEFVDPDRDPVRTQEHGVRAYNTLVVAAGAERLSLTELTEKEITNAMLKVLRDRRERVCFTVGHGERGSGDLESDLGRLAGRLREIDYVVRDSLFLAREPRVPDDCRVLIVAGPRTPFLAHEVDAIRSYLGRGGSLLLLADALQQSGLEGLAREWGVVTGDDFVIDTSGIGSLFGLDFTIPVVTTYDGGHPIVRHHRGGVMTFYELARSVGLDSAAVAAVPAAAAVLARTSSSSWAESDLSVLRETGGGGERTVSLDDADRRGPVGLGAAVADTVGGGRLVVFGDADFASNRYFDAQGNGDLALNAVSWLAEDEALISIRPREPGFNPIALTEAQSEWIFWITVILYPAAIAVAGFFVVSRSGRWSLRDLAAAGLGVVLSLGVLGLLNYLGDRYHWRLDLTEDQLFTLAPESLELLREAGEADKYIQVRTFMSDMEGGRFQEIAEEYGYNSRRFDFETVDPQKDALLVRQYGIRERGTSIVEVTGGGKMVTERFTEQSEEALSNAIRRALAADERAIGFVGGHGEGRLTDVDGEGFSILNGRLKEMNLQIRDDLRPGTDDLNQVQVLAILGPRTPLGAAEVAGVRRFLERGGDLLLLVDPARDSGLEDLLRDEYDIDIGDDFVVDLSGLGQLLGTDVSVPVVLRYGDHPITEGAFRGQMSFFPMARSVSATSGGFGVDALASTDRNAWGESDLAVLAGDEGGSIDFDPETDRPGPISLAVAVTAEADSAEGEETRIVVFGDADFARNQYFGEQANGELMASSVRWLAEAEESLTIPPKQPRFNPINLVGTAGSAILWISVFVLPFAVALSGFVIMLRRGYATYVSGFVTWLVYNFLALGTWYYILGVIGLGEASLWSGEGYLLLGLLCGGLGYGLYRRDPRAWPPALATLAANAGLAFVAVPEPTLQLVLAGLSIANACILVWIRRDFQPAAAAA